MTKFVWPDRSSLSAPEFGALLEHASLEEIANHFGVSEALVASWRNQGVPAGIQAALVRFVAAANGVDLTAGPHEACLLCGEAAIIDVESSSVCDSCARTPFAAIEALGFATQTETTNASAVVKIIAPQPFEFPLCAKFERAKRGFFGTAADVEIGDDEFDAALHIETEDYEALFDTLQQPRRRDLVRNIIQRGGLVLHINVDTVVFAYLLSEDRAVPDKHEQFRVARFSNLEIDRLKLLAALLAWSLVHERAPHL